MTTGEYKTETGGCPLMYAYLVAYEKSGILETPWCSSTPIPAEGMVDT